MAVTFAIANGLVLIAYTAVLAGEVMGILRAEVKAFMEHELTEVAVEVSETDGSVDSIRTVLAEVARPTGEPDCGLRVRDASGSVIAEAGMPYLLEMVTDPVPANVSWRSRLLSDSIAVKSLPLGEHRVEIVVDAREPVARIYEFLETALMVFLAGAALTGLTGWLTAHRGLRSLREVISHAGAVRSSMDVTPVVLDGAPREVREVGTALNGMLTRLHATLERMRTFTAGLAHELRSPLQNLVGETEVTLMAPRRPEEYREVLRSNLEDLYDLTDAVDNLVTFCRTSEPEKTGADVERFDLAREAALRLEREQRIAARKGIRLALHESGDTHLDADRESVLRLLRNLVANALIWSPDGGNVSVGIVGDAQSVRIVVEDDGPGVQKELEPRIFEPFVTGQLRQGKRGGYGLGLAICRSIVDDHGGTIEHDRSPLGGARFIASFPRRIAPSA